MLRFQLGPFPVTVEGSFLLTAVLLGGLGSDIIELLAWVFVVFLSVLVHELGHAVVGKALGGRPEIFLQGMGGLTYPRIPRRIGALAQIVLSVAGPLAGLLLGVAALLALLPRQPWLANLVATDPAHLLSAIFGGAHGRTSLTRVDNLLFTFVRTSLIWTLLNLLPILPLDGGNVLASAIGGVRGRPSFFPAAIISAVLASAIALWAGFVRHDFFLALLFGFFAFSNVGRARAERGVVPRGPREPDVDPAAQADAARGMAQARAALSSGDVPQALAIADELEAAADPDRAAAGLRIRAGIALAQGHLTEAGLHAGRSYSFRADPDAAVVAARAALREGDRERASTWLSRAFDAGAPREAVQADAELASLLAS